MELIPDIDPDEGLNDPTLTYLGWSRGATPPSTPVTCLHHPDDPTTGGSYPLRISSSDNPVFTNTVAVPFPDFAIPIAADQLWDILYPVGQRVTHASSGAPLFDASHFIVGHLVGGEDDCDVVDDTYYGRFDKAWDGEGTPATALKYWLNPDNVQGVQSESVNTRNPFGFICPEGTEPNLLAYDLDAITPFGYDHFYNFGADGDADVLQETPLLTPEAYISPISDEGTTFGLCYTIAPPDECTSFFGDISCQENIPWYDLYMKDGAEDVGIEPNEHRWVSDYGDYNGNGDYWEYVNEDMWDSPDLWNRAFPVSNFSIIPNEHEPPEQTAAGNLVNTAMVEVRNRGAGCSPEAELHLYWAVATTGELWSEIEAENDWINHFHACDDGGLPMLVGDEITTTPLQIAEGDIPPGESKKYGHHWFPPSETRLEACGIDPDGHGGLDHGGVFEICLLARLVSDQDPIGTEVNGGVKPNVINSNNIVTRNSFILEVAGIPPGGVIAENDIIKYILVRNGDNFATNLNVTFDGLMRGASGQSCSNDYYIDFVLSPALWDKWESTGKQGQGISIIAPYVVRITDCAVARLLNIPFDPREAVPLGLRAVAAAGKTEAYLPSPNFSFQISHEATNPNEPLQPPSACLFKVVNSDFAGGNPVTPLPKATSLTISPNPFNNGTVINFSLTEESPVSIHIYDLFGRLMTTLVGQQVYQAGTHQLYFDGKLPNGLYLVNLATPTYQTTSRMIKVD